METLAEIPFTLDPPALLRQAHLESGTDDARHMLALIERAARVGRPKAAYAVCDVAHRDTDSVEIDGVTFTSRALARNLASSHRVFPVIATCGREMDEARPAGGDMLEQFWWDLIKVRLLAAVHGHLDDFLHRRFRLGKTATMHPGSADASVWPIQQQRELFALLGDVESAIGVRLTESFLMVPNKTTSGILFPTEIDFRSCEVCHRENCPSRAAPFNPQLWEEIRDDK